MIDVPWATNQEAHASGAASKATEAKRVMTRYVAAGPQSRNRREGFGGGEMGDV